jgi:CubicO group peptidase (beta-lactamase class C family)
MMNTVSPETVGVSSSRLARIQIAMQSFVDQCKLPGAVTLIARRGQVVHTGCYGWRDLEAKSPMGLGTLFPIFSITKTITSVALMMLYEEGRFQLYEPVSKFIPEFKGGKVFVKNTGSGMELVDAVREITIRDLLVQTAGLATGFGVDQPLARVYAEAGLYQRNISPQAFAQKIAGLPRLHQPGAAWRYGEAYEVLAYLVEILSGMPFNAFLKQRIFDPLGMVDTGFGFPMDAAERTAKFYTVSDTGHFVEGIEPDWLASTADPRGGFGLVSTAADCLRFAQMLLNQGVLDETRLLGRKTVQLMTQNHLPQSMLPLKISPDFGFDGCGYGLGFRVLMDEIASNAMGSKGEYGWYGYGGTYFWVDPLEELVGMILMRLDVYGYMNIAGPLSFFTLINPFRVLTYQALIA